MSDLVKQLRAIAGRTSDEDDHVTLHLAADEIERLRTSNKYLTKCLERLCEQIDWS
jgi:hypothetical protein